MNRKNWLSECGWFIVLLIANFLEFLLKFIKPKKKNSLVSAGWFVMFVASLYAWQIHKAYGEGNPKDTAQWIAEALVGFLFVSAMTLISVGRYLRDER